MKKIFAILFLLVYGLSSSGMTIRFHYCCGKLKTVGLSPATQKQCGMKHMPMSKKKCCDDKQVELKLKADQNTQQAAKFVFSTPFIQRHEAVVFDIEPTVSKTIVPEIFAPPPQHTPLFILNCTYRI